MTFERNILKISIKKYKKFFMAKGMILAAGQGIRFA